MSDIKILIGADIKELEQKLAVAKSKLSSLGQEGPRAIAPLQQRLSGLTFPTKGIENFGSKLGGLATIFKSTGLVTSAAMAGIGIAIAAASKWFQILAKDFITVGKSTEESAKKIKEYNDLVKASIQSTAKENTEVLTLIGILNNETETRGRKLSAIKELQKIQPEIFKNIKLEGDAVIGLDDAYKAYLANLTNVIQAKIIQGQLETAITRQLELQRILTSVGGKNIFLKETKDLSAASLELLKSQKEVADKIFKTRKIFGEGITGKQAAEELDRLNILVIDLAKQLGELSKTNPLKGIDEKKIRTVSDVLADLKKQTDLLNKRQDLLGTDETKAKISALKKAFDELIKDFKLKASNPIIIDIVARVRKLEYEDLLKDTNLGDTFFANRTIGIDKPVIVKFKKIQFDTKAAGIDESLIKFQDEVTGAISQTIANIGGVILSAAADSIADALTGGKGVLPRLFDNIIKGIGQQLKELGQYLVKIGIAKLSIDKAIEALKISPAVTIAVGFATQVLGSLLIAQAQKKAGGLGQGFASGTTGVNQGGIYDVGERGPERIFLPAGAKVQPNNELNAFSGGNQVFIPAVTLSGPDLVIAFNRASQMMNRNN
jgi:hypothetical protein